MEKQLPLPIDPNPAAQHADFPLKPISTTAIETIQRDRARKMTGRPRIFLGDYAAQRLRKLGYA